MFDFIKNTVFFEDMKSIVNTNTIDWEQFNNKRVLITGGTGMLASYMVYTLIYLNENKPNYKVNLILTVRNYKKCEEKFGKYINKDYFDIYEGDINKQIDITTKIDFIIHAASLAITQYFTTNPIEVMLPNSLGVNNLLELAVKNKVESFLFFSTGSVYGKMTDNYTESMYGALDPLEVGSCYSESKRFGETLCEAYFRQKSVPVKIVRIAHTYGPTMDLKNDKRVFADFVRNIINNQNIIMKSDGRAVRCFCYLSDATDAFFRILLNGKNGEAYNMCNNKEKSSIIDLAETLVSLFPERRLKVIRQIRKDNDYYVENNYLKDYDIISDKLISLGWIPHISIRNGFLRTIRSFKEKDY